MSNYLIQGETLTNIANAIRTKTGKTDSIATENMATEISGIADYPLYQGAVADVFSNATLAELSTYTLAELNTSTLYDFN